MPLASPVISGLINLRGQIVTAIDLRRRLELPDRGRPDADERRRAHGGRRVSLLVDEIGDVLEVDRRASSNRRPRPSGRRRDLISGVYKLPDRLLLVLDVANGDGDDRDRTDVGPERSIASKARAAGGSDTDIERSRGERSLAIDMQAADDDSRSSWRGMGRR